MIIITSPAKSLNFEADWPERLSSQPLFPKEVNTVVNVIQKKSIQQLKKLFGVSLKLAELNYQRYQDWQDEHSVKNSKAAIFAYAGDIYRQLKVKDYSEKQLEFINKRLRIISGLYGFVRPFDLIQPYRLEMSTHLRVGTKKNLYDFWHEKLTNQLNEEIKQHKSSFILNLASHEYFKAIDVNKLNVDFITVEFRQEQSGKLLNTGILAKLARGMMINFIIMNKIDTLDKIKEFNVSGYKFFKEEGNSIYFKKTK